MRLYLKTGAFCKKSHYQSQRLEYKIYFAAAFVPNLFCSGFRSKFILQRLECKIYFAVAFVPNLFCSGFRSKFILQRLECKIYFAFCAIGVQNLFCKDPIFNAPYKN